MTMTSWYRRAYWMAKGSREYTRSGFQSASAKFDEKDLDVDCSGRHCLITGGNSGLGLATAHALATRGAVLHLVCRNIDTAEQARANIVTETGNDKIYLYQLDLSKPRDVLEFAVKFAEDHEQLHLLILNAGCMQSERVLDEHDIEYTFAVNTLASHLLVTTLVPVMQKCPDSRVVMVSSGGMLLVKMDPVDLNFSSMDPYSGSLAYSQTKRQQVVLTLSYAQLYDRVRFYCMHPGWADTPSVRTALPDFYAMMKDRLRSPQQGADTVVWLAVSKRVLRYPSGLFFQDRESVATHLPLAWTRSSVVDQNLLLENLQKITSRLFQTKSTVEEKLDNAETTAQDCNTNKSDQNELLEESSKELVNVTEKSVEGEQPKNSPELLSDTDKPALVELETPSTEQLPKEEEKRVTAEIQSKSTEEDNQDQEEVGNHAEQNKEEKSEQAEGKAPEDKQVQAINNVSNQEKDVNTLHEVLDMNSEEPEEQIQQHNHLPNGEIQNEKKNAEIPEPTKTESAPKHQSTPETRKVEKEVDIKPDDIVKTKETDHVDCDTDDKKTDESNATNLNAEFNKAKEGNGILEDKTQLTSSEVLPSTGVKDMETNKITSTLEANSIEETVKESTVS